MKTKKQQAFENKVRDHYMSGQSLLGVDVFFGSMPTKNVIEKAIQT